MSPDAAGTARLLPLELAGGAGRIEALLQERDGAPPAFVALVCHPHPLFGGTLNNKVVHRVASTLFGLGATVLRFNFRGAGRSEGAFTGGAGELADAQAAMAFLAARHPGARRWVAGFSFGAWIAARVAAADAGIERLILVAPPVHTQSFAELERCATPKLVVQGTADEVCRPENLARVYPAWAEPKRLVEVAGAGHYFDRLLGPLADAILSGLAPAG